MRNAAVENSVKMAGLNHVLYENSGALTWAANCGPTLNKIDIRTLKWFRDQSIKKNRRTQDGRQIFIVDYMLHFCNDDASSVLKVIFIRLAWSLTKQIFSNAIVFPNPKSMHDGQQGLLVHSVVTYMKKHDITLNCFTYFEGKLYFTSRETNRINSVAIRTKGQIMATIIEGKCF